MRSQSASRRLRSHLRAPISRMATDWLHGEVLKAVFPLLDGKDLASCMLVCCRWRDIAKEDYFWKCACAKRWPSICRRPLPALGYYKLFKTFSRPQRPQPLLPPRLSFNDLEFYIDLWSEQKLIFSEAISGSMLRTGIRNPPPGISDILKVHLNGPDYKMVVQAEPRFTITLGSTITVSVLVGRKDTNQIACIIRDSVFDYVDGSAFRALAYAYLNFSPGHPFISGIRAWVSLLFVANGNENAIDVFGIEIDFCDAASKEHEVLWLLDMLDWK
ncbi:F-box protein At5g39250 isoform X1 [Elaeis guineensis]